VGSNGESSWRVLLIDDSEIALMIEQAHLTGAGFDVRTAMSLDEFDTVLADWSPDVILTDVEMPDIDGGSLCRMLKARIETKNAPVVLFSGLSEEKLACLAEEVGADAYVSKENGLDRLVERLEDLCSSILW
jgi:CheY-like chemotaxis protein